VINGSRRQKPRGAFRALVIGGVAVVTLAACGGSDGTTASSSTSRATGTTRAPLATATTLPATTTVPATATTVPPVAATAAATATTTAYVAEPATGALKKGMKGNRVAAVQTKLAKLGYDPGPADGLFGAKTDTAVRKFQSDKSLAVDGVVGNQTVAALDADCKAKNVC
jgi:peptidoglycan hydrolase-like protein with peptidoglycan-binding domain